MATVEQAMEERQIAPCDPKLAVFFFKGAIKNINRWFTENGPLAGEQIAQALADHTIACLASRTLSYTDQVSQTRR